ncbi:rRNA biogenesis protein rrp5 [Anaerocolumna sp. MB42-C2]|uniref:rRNA biogenesis protein rrp5 n=1 Tax=Anaerocolumna sp. MB42-C2 TaxID=3070997 RepID=UPI0027DED54B|nr:rRNA biogenesis protein rrp5 [Anaerocolumna sp. MB42-C2]WMJ86737.1 rRNA biogenesis protein rrp5 [Anaerocolumna sp. MB42-C2]
MSKVSLLLDVINDLKKLTGSLQTLAETFDTNVSAGGAQAETSALVTETKPAKKKITLEQVREVLAEKSHDGFTAEIRALLEKYGADKLSKIDSAHYAALLADAEALK